MADQQDQQDSGPALQHEGPRPPSGLKSRPQSAHGQGRVSTSQPHTTNEGVEPGFSLGANEAALLDQTVVERKGSRPSSACSHSTSLHGRALSPSPDFAGAERKVVGDLTRSLIRTDLMFHADFASRQCKQFSSRIQNGSSTKGFETVR